MMVGTNTIRPYHHYTCRAIVYSLQGCMLYDLTD
ncbi:hypothetical protein HNP25_004136 [Arcicella rosea]|uniref:Uncharacterized protein n=1 Tax=Arcicella rosea TaxID=502909 RepID=A0A841ENX6_9BACT|nr:hypothetical protein [Arcicella rosea]